VGQLRLDDCLFRVGLGSFGAGGAAEQHHD
jgi:hypothetical protein